MTLAQTKIYRKLRRYRGANEKYITVGELKTPHNVDGDGWYMTHIVVCDGRTDLYENSNLAYTAAREIGGGSIYRSELA